MQWSGLWLILALMVVILGVFFVMRNLRRNNLAPESEALGVKTKYGLPIIPRDERVLPSRVEGLNKKVEPEDTHTMEHSHAITNQLWHYAPCFSMLLANLSGKIKQIF